MTCHQSPARKSLLISSSLFTLALGASLGTSWATPVVAKEAKPTATQALGGPVLDIRADALSAAPILNVSTDPIRQAYLPGEVITFRTYANYESWIEKAEILILDPSKGLARPPLAVLPAPANGTVQWTMPEGQAWPEEAVYILRVTDAQGRMDETVPLSLHRPSVLEPVDVTDPALSVGALADRAASRNIPVKGGTITVIGSGAQPGTEVETLGQSHRADDAGRFVIQSLLPHGTHDVSVRLTDRGGVSQYDRQVELMRKNWFYTGIADLTFGKQSADAGIDQVRSGKYDELWSEGRLAFYAKGELKPGWLLTAAADTTEQELDNLFGGFGDQNPRELLRRLDPNDHYPVYGDDSTLIEDAPTAGRFYVRLDKDQSHLMWGSYKASIQGTEFLRSERGLYGAQGVYRSNAVTDHGEAQVEATLYGAQPGTLPQRDEFAGTSGSAYFLRRQDITTGSESVQIEIRDPITGHVLDRRLLMHGIDYRIDYMQGMLILTNPLSSTTTDTGAVRNGALGGSSVRLVVSYEYVPTVTDLDGYAFGGRATAWVNDNLRVGFTGMSENTGSANQEALAADVLVRYSDLTYLEAEVARSEGPGFGISRSFDGGLTLSDELSTGVNGRSAYAWRAKGQADLTELGMSRRGTVSAYVEQREAGFSTLAEQIASDQTRWGVATELSLSDRLGLSLDYSDFDDSAGGARSEGNAALVYTASPYTTAKIGVTSLDSRSSIARASGKSGYNGDRIDVGARLDYRRDRREAWVFAQTTVRQHQDIADNDRIGAGFGFPVTERLNLSLEASTGSSGLGGLINAEYRPTVDDSYYIGYRLDPDRAYQLDRPSLLSGRDRGAVVGGVKRRLGETVTTFAEHTYDMFGKQRTTAQTYGMVYTPTPRWTFEGGMEIGRVQDDTINPNTGRQNSDFDRTGVSFTMGLADDPNGVSGRWRVEARVEESDDKTRNRETYLASTTTSVRLSPDWRLLLNVDAVLTSQEGNGFDTGEYVESAIGFAYRPTTNDRLNALMRYTWFYDQPAIGQATAAGDSYGPAQRSHIFSADMIYDLTPRVALGLKYGARLSRSRMRDTTGTEQFGPWQRSDAHLGIIRTDIRWTDKWDVLAEGRVMHMPSADTVETGAVLGVYRRFNDQFRIGGGYNWGRFSDDLRDMSLDDQGWFINLLAVL